MDVSHAPGAGVESAFLRELIYQLGEHARRGGTAYGAAVVAKRVGVAHGLSEARDMHLPRPTRAEREDAAWLAQRDVVRTDAAAGAVATVAASGCSDDQLGEPAATSGQARRGRR